MRLIQRGNNNARIIICGEAPGADEDRLGRAFVGISGNELDQELGLAGFQQSEIFFTNVCHERPPNNDIEHFFAKKSQAKKAPILDGVDIALAVANLADGNAIATLAGRFPTGPIIRGLVQLQLDIDRVQPTLIIALGNTALWALTGHTGILKWRGSILEATGGPVHGNGCKLIPTLHPAYVLREYVYRTIVIHDLKRARRESRFPEIRKPIWNFTIPTSLSEVRDWFDEYVLSKPIAPIASDVENTIGDGHLICLGFAADKTNAMCVPFMHKSGNNPNYWDDPDDELAITNLCIKILRSRPIIFHNGLHDCQILSNCWGVMPNFTHDTMVQQHVAYPGMLGGKIDPLSGKVDKKGSSLSLSFCSSMYCNYHRFWKDDGRGWDSDTDDEIKYWNYNCEDNVRTYEIHEELLKILEREKLIDQYHIQMNNFGPVFQMMFQGVSFDDELRHKFIKQVDHDAKLTQAWIEGAVGHNLNCDSSPQIQDLFYHDFNITPILHRKTKKPTLDDKALDVIKRKNPILKPLIERIQAIRSLGKFRKNFLNVKLAPDNKLKGAINVAGPETMRFSSNINALGEGMNLQNLPRPEE